jgi:hypothetical protein
LLLLAFVVVLVFVAIIISPVRIPDGPTPIVGRGTPVTSRTGDDIQSDLNGTEATQFPSDSNDTENNSEVLESMATYRARGRAPDEDCFT